MYNPKNAEMKKAIKTGTKAKAVIIDIENGTTKDFIANVENWKGDLDAKAINVTVEFKHEEESHTMKKIFNYKEEAEKTVYHETSNLGKYFKTYGKLPEFQDIVEVEIDNNGFWQIVITKKAKEVKEEA